MEKKNIVCALLFACSVGMFGQSDAKVKAYIAKYASMALKQEKEYGIPAPITLAQGILESGAGTSLLASVYNNHFGIKALGRWNGEVYYAWDDESTKSCFRCYDSVEESFRDHAMLLRNEGRYKKLFRENIYDYRRWAIGLQKAGYATAKDYARKLIEIIDKFQLYAMNGGQRLIPGHKVRIPRQPMLDSSVSLSESQNGEITINRKKINEEKVMSFVGTNINGVKVTVLYRGEGLSDIAKEYDISVTKLMTYNDIYGDESFKEGDVVYLKRKRRKFKGPREFYRVKPGDTLHSISQQFGIRLSSLAKMNKKDYHSVLEEGERIRLR